MENLNLATNAELQQRQEELQAEFEETKMLVAKYMLHLEELEKEYMDIGNILNKRLKKE
jgi:hypothetical protein|uniref:Uncharacterized protein n=1 Tax=Myoviridae sp. ctPuP5 TaxID=2823543 RepID=A0A8S5L9D5_9CAUD|nr:MAG TPA: hypothetical protein [Myoviridae sp. ctPuP5]